MKYLLPLVTDFDAYYEPFLGGGALFFALRPGNSVLSDKNPELVNAYVQVRDNCELIIEALRRIPNRETTYYGIRDERPRSRLDRAVRFLYLTRLAFNGIYRLNLKGEFNVPYGEKKHLSPCDPEHLRRTSVALRNAQILLTDFEHAVKLAKRDDLVYLDPPYTVAHGNNGFLKYNAKIFSWEDQVRLAATARRLCGRGCRVIISNADHPSIRELYRGFRLEVIQRYSVMAASPEHRRSIQECIFFAP